VTGTRIPPDEVDFHPHSFGDRDGRLFRWNGQLYRALGGVRSSFFRELFRSGVVERLSGEGLLVETEPTSLQLDGYEFVVRHREVPFPSYPIEWSPTMFRDAALVYLRLIERLLPLGLTLKDVHPWNLLFDFSRPVYVDLTSVTALDNGLPAPEKVARYYLRPLLLMERGGERIARCLLLDYEAVQDRDLALLGVDTGTQELHAAIGSRGRLRSKLDSLRRRPATRDAALPSEWRRIVEAMRLPDATHASRGEDATPEALRETIRQLRPASILLLRDEGGSLSSLAASAGSAVVVLDEESRAVTTLYRRTRETGAHILPLTVDFSRPTPSVGFSNHYSIAASDRLQCDLLVARRTAVDALVGKRSLRPDQLAEGFAQFTRRWLVLETAGDEEAFEAALHPLFRTMKRVPVSGRPAVVLFERRGA
jgi:hypothetical protein